MKRALALLCPVLALGLAVGCDELLTSGMPAEVQAIAASLDPLKLDMASSPIRDRTQDQDRLRLHDGSCDGTGSQNRVGGGNGAGGNGDGDRLRLRDGSCGG